MSRTEPMRRLAEAMRRFAEPMRRALALAEQGRYGASPNPMVGAVVLDASGAVVGEGAHLRCGGPHAEVNALAAARGLAAGGTLVVTLEPCAHVGRTPPCVDAVIASRVKRVVIGTRDPNPRSTGGVERLRAAGIEVVEGVEDQACRALNRRFFHWATTGAPWVTQKMAMTLDGKLASRGGRSRWITSEASRREGYALREEHDAVLVGVGTALADDPRLLRHLGLNPDPHVRRVVLDTSLRLSPDAALLTQQPEDVLVYTLESAPDDRRRALQQAGARVLEVGDDGRGHCDLRQVLRSLAAMDVSSVLVEGGGETHWSFLHEGLSQRLIVFVAPLVLGGREAVPAVGGLGFGSPQEAIHMEFVEVRRLDTDLVLTAEVTGV